MPWLVAVLSMGLICGGFGFEQHRGLHHSHSYSYYGNHHRTAASCHRVRDHHPLLASQDGQLEWDFSLLTRADLREAATLALECFYSPRIQVDFSDFDTSSIEYHLWSKVLSCYNAVDRFDAWNGNYIGFATRCASRLDSPSFGLSRESLLIGARVPGEKDLVGIVEVCLEVPLGSLTPPVANPFRDKNRINLDAEPYLCNLCVRASHRRRGLGRALCEFCEGVIVEHWSYGTVFIHVEAKNSAAMKLYQELGYHSVERTKTAKKAPEGVLFYWKDLD